MSTREQLSPAITQMTHQYIDGERFSTTNDVLLFSLHLLSSFEQHYQEQLGQNLAAVVSDMESGEKSTFANATELNEFFDDIMKVGRSRAAQS